MPYGQQKAGLHTRLLAYNHLPFIIIFRIVFLINLYLITFCFSELTDILLCGIAGSDNLQLGQPFVQSLLGFKHWQGATQIAYVQFLHLLSIHLPVSPADKADQDYSCNTNHFTKQSGTGSAGGKHEIVSKGCAKDHS